MGYYLATMAAMYGGTSVTMYPLLREDNVNIIVLMPTQVRSELEPLLDLHNTEMVKIVQEGRNRVKAVLRTITEHGHWSQVSEAAGSFAGAMLAAYQRVAG